MRGYMEMILFGYTPSDPRDRVYKFFCTIINAAFGWREKSGDIPSLPLHARARKAFNFVVASCVRLLDSCTKLGLSSFSPDGSTFNAAADPLFFFAQLKRK